jgi:hypothetical protein
MTVFTVTLIALTRIEMETGQEALTDSIVAFSEAGNLKEAVQE